MKQRTLGMIAILCSPFLFVDFLFDGNGQISSTSMGWCDMIYMLGWMCSILGLLGLQAAGKGTIGKSILALQMLFLVTAQLWNTLVLLHVSSTALIFKITDVFWPISNMFMLVTAVAIIRAKVLVGWKRFVPLAVGLWLPLSAIIMIFYKQSIVLTIFRGP